ncbi:MAG TPA: glycosyltransferase family 39 protein [Phycisphaerae bacterium]|nr:glycosyltransferase family 39 protein [Phycisphaerae bacterium]HNU45145.1 glycosyltransferase family 39 protein [Phycisphaerae bacterium]
MSSVPPHPTTSLPLRAGGLSRTGWVFGLLLATLAGAGLRFLGLGGRDFWFDESCTFIYVHQLFCWPEGSSLLRESTNLPYYLLLSGWTWLLGDSEAAYRSLSALAATLTVPLLGVVAWRLGGRAAGLVGAALAACNPLHVYYAHEARAYALWVLLLAVMLWLLVEAARRERSAVWWVTYATMALLALHVHYYTVFFLAASVSVVALRWPRRTPTGTDETPLSRGADKIPLPRRADKTPLPHGGEGRVRGEGPTRPPSPLEQEQTLPRDATRVPPSPDASLEGRGVPPAAPGEDWRRTLRRWLVVTGIIAVAFVPYSLLAVLPAAGGGGNVWLAEQWQPRSALGHSLWAFLPAGDYPAHLRGLSLASPDTRPVGSPGLVAIARIAPALLLLALLALLARQAAAPATQPDSAADVDAEADTPVAIRGRHFFLSVLTLGPLVLAWLYSALIRPIYLPGRYDLVAWPAFAVWMAVLVAQSARLCRPPHQWRCPLVLTVVLVACSAVPLARLLLWRPPPSPAHLRAEKLTRLAGSGGLAIAFSYDRDYLLYYLHRAGFAGRIISFPTWLDEQIGWVDTEADLARAATGALDREVERVLREVEGCRAQGDRVFLLGDSLDPLGTGPREVLHQRLFRALREGKYDTLAADSEHHIWELRSP